MISKRSEVSQDGAPNLNKTSDCNYYEYGIPYMRDIPKYEYKKKFKKHEKRLHDSTKSVSSD